jgi:pimeloyl-ACP methyl ester carboxylesterase
MTEPKTSTLTVPGAVLHYDVRTAGASRHPVLLMIGSPMGADGFATLAGHFTDRTVVTYDPRSSGRSKRTDGTLETTPDEHADDLHRLIAELDAGPVDIFASSGGAVNALALVAKHPEQVRTLVAHEPPAIREAPDSGPALAVNEDIRQTYLRSGFGPAMAKFIAFVGYEGLIGPDYLDRPAPDPVLRHNIITSTHYEHDFDALRAASTRVVIGVGEDSAQVITGRTSVGVASRLGAVPVTFPGGHGGFLGDEYGPMGGKPDAFAVVLRDVLDD